MISNALSAVPHKRGLLVSAALAGAACLLVVSAETLSGLVNIRRIQEAEFTQGDEVPEGKG